MARRHLVSQIRDVALASRTRYDARWGEVQRAVTERGAHAWRFVSGIQPDRYIEFLEFAADADPREDAGVSSTLRALDEELGAALVEEWRDDPQVHNANGEDDGSA